MVTNVMVDIFDAVIDGSDHDFVFLPSRLALAAWVQHLLTVVVSNKGVTEAKTTLLLCSLLPFNQKSGI